MFTVSSTDYYYALHNKQRKMKHKPLVLLLLRRARAILQEQAPALLLQLTRALNLMAPTRTTSCCGMICLTATSIAARIP
jgi:hypothetical protein